MRDVTTRYGKWRDQRGLGVDWNMTRATRIYASAKMPDLCGNIPYAEAERPKEFSYPRYDSQKSMHKEILKELDKAQVRLASGEAAISVQDLYYKGGTA